MSVTLPCRSPSCALRHGRRVIDQLHVAAGTRCPGEQSSRPIDLAQALGGMSMPLLLFLLRPQVIGSISHILQIDPGRELIVGVGFILLFAGRANAQTADVIAVE